jgi:hypothetical protein
MIRNRSASLTPSAKTSPSAIESASDQHGGQNLGPRLLALAPVARQRQVELAAPSRASHRIGGIGDV